MEFSGTLHLRVISWPIQCYPGTQWTVRDGAYSSTISPRKRKKTSFGNCSDRSEPYRVLKSYVISKRTNVKDSGLWRWRIMTKPSSRFNHWTVTPSVIGSFRYHLKRTKRKLHNFKPALAPLHCLRGLHRSRRHLFRSHSIWLLSPEQTA